ncbi:MAG: PAS domain S-box protein, partial [Methylococcus sp.]
AGEPHRGEWRQRRADGATFLAQVTAQRLDAECYYATLRDITRQRELEAAQAETTRRLQLILSKATDGLWDWDIRTGEDFRSPRYREMLGYGPDELPTTAAGFEAIVHPDDLPRVKAALQAHLEQRAPYQIELRLRTKSGDYRWFVTRGQAEWDADDQPLRMAGFITDISGRKAAEEALQASEARLDYALTQSHTGACTMNLDDHTAQHTLEHDRLFGYAAPQTHWTYERFLEHVVPEERDAVDSQFRAAVSQKTAILFVCRIRRTDGEIRWFQVNGEYQPPKDGGAPRFSGIVRDITEAKALEQSLRAELALREQLQQTSENVPGVIYTFRYGPDGRMSMPYASAKLLDLTGYPPEAVTDDVGPLLDLIHPEDAERVRASIEASAQRLTLWGETFRLSHPVRGEVWIEGNSSPSRAADGSIYWHGFMSDITERKANERMLRLNQFAMENAVDEVYYIRQDGRFQYVNDAACRALEYRREELLTMTVPEVDPLFSEETWREHWRILKAEGSRTLETLHRSRSGRVYPVEIHVNFIEHEGQEYSCSICRDISERKLAEQALHDSNDRYDELVRRIPAGVYTLHLHAGTPRFEYVSGKLLPDAGPG